MEHKITITVPEDVYQPLVEEALRKGRTPEEEASLRLESSVTRRNNQHARGSLEELFGSVSLGHPTGADNESIDRDLARAYADTHEDER